MRVSLVGFAVVFLLVPAGLARAVGENDPYRDDGSIRYRFYVGTELLYINRDGGPDVPVSYDHAFSPSQTVISTNDVLGDDWDFGGRGYLGMRLNPASSLELVYMGWGQSESKDELRPSETLDAFEFPEATAFPNEAFDDAAYHELKYDSVLHSGELNYRHRLHVEGTAYHFNLLAGLRAIRFEENLRLDSWDEIIFGIPPAAFRQGQYDVSTRNTLVGLQMGVDTFVPLWQDRVDLDISLTAGPYANQAKVYSNYFDGNADAHIRQSHSEWDASGVLEGAATFQIRLWRGVRMNLGYRALYLINVAAAPENFAHSGSAGDFFGNSYVGDAEVLFHGASIGFGVDF